MRTSPCSSRRSTRSTCHGSVTPRICSYSFRSFIPRSYYARLRRQSRWESGKGGGAVGCLFHFPTGCYLPFLTHSIPGCPTIASKIGAYALPKGQLMNTLRSYSAAGIGYEDRRPTTISTALSIFLRPSVLVSVGKSTRRPLVDSRTGRRGGDVFRAEARLAEDVFFDEVTFRLRLPLMVTILQFAAVLPRPKRRVATRRSALRRPAERATR